MKEREEKVEQAIEEFRAGRMVILTDDKERENEGDLCMAAEKVTPEAIAFMASEGRGLVCLTITERRARQLHLPLMVRNNRSRFGTNFTVSIDAREGISTGISAADRARTVRLAVSPDASPDDLVSPGHVFPLQSVPGGVLERAGQTEGSVDLARLAGLVEAGVICEIMKADGTMARGEDLARFAREHGLHLLDIGDIIGYRVERESLIGEVWRRPVEIPVGGRRHAFTSVLFRSGPPDDAREYLALVHGGTDASPTLCRVHMGRLAYDLFGLAGAWEGVTVAQALGMIVREGRGVFVFFPPSKSIAEELGADAPRGERGLPVAQEVLREFGMGAQVLARLGLKKLRLITKSPKKLPALEGFGLEVTGNVAPGE